MKAMVRLAIGLVACVVLAGLVAPATPVQVIAGPWVELGTNNDLQVRVVVPSGVSACPIVVADGNTIGSRQRGPADGGFPVTVCSATVPLATTKLSLGGDAMPTVPSDSINRIVVIGDTGCRTEGDRGQDCSDPEQWPFPVSAKDAAGRKPDLVIHVGDYYYREDSCPAGNKGCADSPHGDNWPTWNADFFEPAAPLLKAAPWVMVRGNHELCSRGGKGWSRLLDPRADLTGCADTSPPYRVLLGALNLLVFDGANADDDKPDPQKVPVYSAQLAQLLANAPPHSWLLTHRPVWALAQGKRTGTLNRTEQAAIKGRVPAGLDMVLSGHLHDFTSYSFGPQRPAQLIVGDGGDTMLDVSNPQLAGAEIDGIKVQKGFALERFGFFVMERRGAGWDGTLYAPDDKTVLARCTINGRDLDCHN